MKATWKPAWHTEKRQPQFAGTDRPPTGHTPFGKKKYLMANVPALDLLNLEQNEGADVSHDLRLLFAASRDLGNVVKTLAGIPTASTGGCEVMINDRDFDIVARNAILLLMALYFEADSAPLTMLHLWYSALIPAQILRAIQENIRPLIQDVCAKIAAKRAGSFQAKKWTYGTRSLRLVLKKEEWNRLLSYFEIPDGLSMTQVHAIRTATTLAAERRDYLDRWLYILPPARRVGAMKFRVEGILLPFGSCRRDFDTTPNPTFFQSKDSWPMVDAADPLDGWSMAEILRKAPLARNDTYRGLFLLVQDTLQRFCQRIENLQVKFQLFHDDALALPNMIEDGQHSFDRIKLSNMADRGWVGPEAALITLAPLLKRASDNPHAILLTLFLNAVHEVFYDTDNIASLHEEMSRLRSYVNLAPDVVLAGDKFNADFIMFTDARPVVRDFDKLFDRWMREHRFGDIGKAVGLKMGSEHTIVPPWPMRLRQNATQREFDRLRASGHVESERYVEWKSVE
ncbi:hypothetical protein H2201_005444 [Coniosporium apollinis]|uniref:DUF4470 domain-containing protein n=1 Tax=Coniosporium apollinis TaxID=61459 RepID=A0ABQ9NT72_9PEZI|nr:hypothetical protein H2201_005444 [Coniosporium apollinis]